MYWRAKRPELEANHSVQVVPLLNASEATSRRTRVLSWCAQGQFYFSITLESVTVCVMFVVNQIQLYTRCLSRNPWPLWPSFILPLRKLLKLACPNVVQQLNLAVGCFMPNGRNRTNLLLYKGDKTQWPWISFNKPHSDKDQREW
jgi:hypothetical protein